MRSPSDHQLIKYALSLLLLFVTGGAIADEYGTTDHGRRILLKDDGTWVNAEKPQVDTEPNAIAGAEQMIQEKCRSDWVDDFRMRAFCEKQQREAVQTLLSEKPQDIPQDQFILVRRKCIKDWPTDFRMRAFCERQQFSAIRELKK
jgi:hypothetical protein